MNLKSTTQDLDSQSTLSFLNGSLASVDVAKIERELALLWRSMRANDDQESPENNSIVRACALNFVVILHESGRQEDMNDLLAALSVRHPSRVILGLIAAEALKAETVNLDKDSAVSTNGVPQKVEKVEAWVSARCHFVPGTLHKQVCCEQITVRTTYQTAVAQSLASVINPLVITDLPAYLYMPEMLPGKNFLTPFLPYFQRLVFESGQCTLTVARALEETKAAIPYLFELSHDHMLFDLSWSLIKPFRVALAQAFDQENVSYDLASLKRLGKVHVHARSAGQGLLFFAWLADRLELASDAFDCIDAHNLKFSLKAGNEFCAGDIECHLSLLPCQLHDDALLGIESVELNFASTGEFLTIKNEGAALRVSDGEKEEFVELHMGNLREFALEKVLTKKCTDPYYLRALGLLAGFACCDMGKGEIS